MVVGRLHGARWYACIAALAASAALGLAACGGSSTPASSAGSTSSSAATTSSASAAGGSSSSTTASASSSASGSSASASSGEKIFTSAGCGGCHTLAAAHASGQVGPNLDQLKPSEAEVVTQVTNGGGAMPSFSGRLSKAEIVAVAKFVASATH